MGLKNLETIEKKVARRNEIADVYKKNLKGLPGISFQEAAPGSRCSYKDVSILIDPKKFGLTRDVLAECLDKENIKTKKYYYPPVHHQKFITSVFKADESKLKVTNYVSENILSLPILTHMNDKDIAAICGAISTQGSHGERKKTRFSADTILSQGSTLALPARRGGA